MAGVRHLGQRLGPQPRQNRRQEHITNRPHNLTEIRATSAAQTAAINSADLHLY
jgi:hypothetical protein